ncbi:hypothetical protein A5646_00605 [Mycobacterium sp. 1245499.0]|nr:hypothetical protein A5646_00605 [Mycobacterium sp. 1245499.0]
MLLRAYVADPPTRQCGIAAESSAGALMSSPKSTTVGRPGSNDMVDHHGDGMLGAGAGRLEHTVAVPVGDLLDHGMGMTIDVVEFERLRCDHGAHRVALAAGRIDLDAHATS